MSWPAVIGAFPQFIDSTGEGKCAWMYLDIKGLATTGRGNLIDPSGAAMGLPWLRKDNTAAAAHEIAAEWLYIKSRTDLAKAGGGAFKDVARLHLSDAAIDALTIHKLLENEKILLTRFPFWANLCADAQLATHCLAWACGAWFDFPRFAIALKNRQYAEYDTDGMLIGGCAVEGMMSTAGNPGLVPHNAANKTCWLAAQRSLDTDRNPAFLFGWKAA
jgi:hypothetical protein